MHGLNPFQSALIRRAVTSATGVSATRGALRAFAPEAATEAAGEAHGLQTLMRRLSARVVRGHNRIWDDKLRHSNGSLEAKEVWENPFIPSGYTYLLQFIAHDLVASAVSQSLNRDVPTAVENTRTRPMCLDTLYGGGPGVHPHAYEFSVAHRDSKGLVPRMRLRVGKARTLQPGAPRCPFRDVGRAMPTDAEDSGRDNSARVDWLTEALVVDPRNDSHALLSQLTVLFHILHNHVIRMLEARHHPAHWTPAELAHRRFLCARHAVTTVYRTIVVNDVLRRILHPEVFAATATFPFEMHNGIRKEFSHGAFRFGHAMIRDSYRVNSERPQDTVRALNQSSTRLPGMVPITREWLVDWSRFFEIDGTVPNLSRRIGPDYAFAIQTEDMFPGIGEGDAFGLAFRDYLSGAFAEVPKVAEVWQRLADFVPPLDVWQAPLRSWLQEIPGDPSLSEPFEPADIDRLVADPPLPFFVQFEAAHALVDGKPVRKGGGRHLGHLGSAIVAETILGAMRHHPLGFESAGTDSRARIAACCRALLDDADALADLGVNGGDGAQAREIASMPDLIGFLDANGAFPTA